MNRLLRWIRRLLVGLGPTALLLIAVAAGFLYWCAGTQQGTRWLLHTAAQQLDGHIDGVHGSIWSGLRVRDVDLKFPGAAVRIRQLQFDVDWRAFLDHRLRVRVLAADRVDLDLASTGEPPSQEPLRMPALPVGIVLEHFGIGELNIRQDGKPLPVGVKDVAAALSLSGDGAQLDVLHAGLSYDTLQVDLDGRLKLLGLADPWPMQGSLKVHAHGLPDDTLLCARRFVPTLPEGDKENPAARACVVDVTTNLKGTLDALNVVLGAQGQGLRLDADADLSPRAGFPLRRARLDLGLPDGSALQARVDWNEETVGGKVQDRVQGSISSSKLDLGALVGPAIPATKLDSTVDFDVRLADRKDLLSAGLQARFGPGSSWNRQPLSGTLETRLVSTVPGAAGAQPGAPAAAALPQAAPQAREVPAGRAAATPAAATGAAAASGSQAGAPPAQAAGPAESWKFLQLETLNMDLRLGRNHLQASGSLGQADSRLKLDLRAPVLSAFWPGLPGGATLSGQVRGSPSAHSTELSLSYQPAPGKPAESAKPVHPSKSARTVKAAKPAHPSKSDKAAKPVKAVKPEKTDKAAKSARSGAASAQAPLAPITAKLAAKGAWNADAAGVQSWHGELTRFEVAQAGMGVRLRGVLPVSLLPQAQAPAWLWQVGAATLEFHLPSGQGFALRHEDTRGAPGRWETRGSIARLSITPRLIRELRTRFGAERGPGNGRVKVEKEAGSGRTELVLAADWNLKFDGALQGGARIRRLSGDVMLPGSPPVPLGLRELELDAKAVKAGAALSRLNLALKIDTAAKGNVSAGASTQLRASKQGGLEFGARQPVDLELHADIADLAWLSLFAGDDTDLGGSLRADVKATRKADGSWATHGTIGGSKLKLVRLDDGVRLFDGTLQAHLDGARLVLDKLQFPARLRVDPKEWRTSEWVHTSPDAKNGSLTLSGDWDLMKSAGTVNIDLHRYPILQRSDRYAMISGKLRIDAEIPRIGITGSLQADAGWFDLDMLSSVPTLDGDVVVLRAGQEAPAATPMDVSMDLKVDLGPRFYITGYGLDSGLVGSMHIIMAQGKLTAEGALRTRGGAITAYGQHLQLRRGTITFQGDIGNPVLNIEALRTGVAVEAGVRVAGTAKRPRIDLVSHPDVSDVEKLSWLLLGRAPDEGGGDTALLLSLGTSLLGGGEPLYRKLGLDEVSIQSGELGSTGSLLPVQTVVNDINNSSSNSTLEQQFVRAGKKISSSITLSIEQALSQTGTVGRLSYRLARGLTAELSTGTVSGIALVYRTFFKD